MGGRVFLRGEGADERERPRPPTNSENHRGRKTQARVRGWRRVLLEIALKLREIGTGIIFNCDPGDKRMDLHAVRSDTFPYPRRNSIYFCNLGSTLDSDFHFVIRPLFRLVGFLLPRPPARPALRAISIRRAFVNFFARARPPRRATSVCSIRLWYP